MRGQEGQGLRRTDAGDPMQIEDDASKPAMPTPVDRMGIAELEAHIVVLRAEIARAEAEIIRKTRLRDAADSVFRKS